MMTTSAQEFFQETLDASEKVITNSIKLRNTVEQKHLTEMIPVIDVIQLFVIGCYDIFALMEPMYGASGLKYKLFARHFCLEVIETINKLKYLMGKDFKDAIDNLQIGNSLLPELKELVSKLSEISNKYQKMLGPIRNKASAHKGHPKELLEIIDSIERRDINNLAWDIQVWIADMLMFASKLFQLTEKKYNVQLELQNSMSAH